MEQKFTKTPSPVTLVTTKNNTLQCIHNTVRLIGHAKF